MASIPGVITDKFIRAHGRSCEFDSTGFHCIVALGDVSFDVTRGSSTGLIGSKRDNGESILPQNLERIFAHSFTTRKEGHGFSLYSIALTATEMGTGCALRPVGAG